MKEIDGSIFQGIGQQPVTLSILIIFDSETEKQTEILLQIYYKLKQYLERNKGEKEIKKEWTKSTKDTLNNLHYCRPRKGFE